MNLIEIAKAWITSFNPNDEQRKVANDRIKICNGCEHKEYKPMFGTFVCGLCSCPIERKIFSENNACPANKWNI